MHKKVGNLYNISKKCLSSPAFTIVELLVVVTIIGILAAITIVSYSGITNKANVASMQAELANAYKKMNLYYVDNNAYPANLAAAKTAKLIPSASETNETYALDNSVTPAYYCYMYRAGNETYAIDSLSGPSKGACLTNLITNGDFSNGTAGWHTEYGTMSVSAGVMADTATGGSYYSVIGQDCTNCAINGHQIYAMLKQRVTNSSATGMGAMIADPISNKNIPFISSPTINNWYTNSGVVSFTGTGNMTFKPDHTYVDAVTATGKVMEIKYASAFDLTAAFGTGNEPTKAQMDTIMNAFTNNWFNGTRKVNL